MTRTLIYDLETSPNLGYVWGRWQQDVIAFEQEWMILSCAWKWLGDKSVHVVTMEKAADDLPVVEKLRELLDTADIVVAHNGLGFDDKKARARMLFHGLEPPSPFRSVDTLVLAKRSFAFTSNRLDDLCQVLGIGRKLGSGGFDTWRGCLQGDPDAWRRLVNYNKHDVAILEKLYLRLLPWAEGHPNVALIAEDPDACPRCGVVGQMIRQGWRYYGVTKRPRFQCKACGGWCQGRKVEKSSVAYVA